MSRQEERSITVYGGRVYGHKVSDYALENGYLDYLTLSKIVGDCILNNTIRSETMTDWEMVAGEWNGDSMIFQDYIISKSGYDFLAEYTDEIVFYNDKLNVYIWAITHYGTSWDYVLTDIKLKGGD